MKNAKISVMKTAPQDPVAREFGAMLRASRERLKMPQRELARRIGRTSATAIGNLEDGMNRPNTETVARLTVVFQWDLYNVMRIFGGPEGSGDKRIGSEIAARPALKRLVSIARDLPTDRLDLLTGIAEGWARER